MTRRIARPIVAFARNLSGQMIDLADSLNGALYITLFGD